MIINRMKFEELTLKLVHTDLISQRTKNLDMQITFVAFNVRGSYYFLFGLNIYLINMQRFVFHAFSLVNHLGILRKVYSQYMDLRIGRELEIKNIVHFSNSFHRISESLYEDLKNQSQYIQNVFEKTTSKQIANN
jgi:hypothetical protein